MNILEAACLEGFSQILQGLLIRDHPNWALLLNNEYMGPAVAKFELMINSHMVNRIKSIGNAKI